MIVYTDRYPDTKAGNWVANQIVTLPSPIPRFVRYAHQVSVKLQYSIGLDLLGMGFLEASGHL